MQATRILLPVALALAAGLAFASPALAGDWSGTHKGPRGGETQYDTSCEGGPRFGHCATNWNHTAPDGRTWEGERGVIYGPRRAAYYGEVTGPEGNTVHRGRVLRRW